MKLDYTSLKKAIESLEKAAVRTEVKKLTQKFPLYPELLEKLK